MEQVLFSLPLNKLEPVVKSWVRDVLKESQPQPPEEKNPKYNVKETAKYLGITIPTVYSKHSRGELPGCKIPGSKRVFFFKRDLDEILKQGRKNISSEPIADASEYLKKRKG